MIRPASLALTLALAALGAAAPAAAEDVRPPPATPATGAADRPSSAGDAAPKVRASHRVDVIAPGERVETVLDRARATSTAPARSAAGAGALPIRAPNRRETRHREDSIRPEAAVRGGDRDRGAQIGEPREVEAPEVERPNSR